MNIEKVSEENMLKVAYQNKLIIKKRIGLHQEQGIQGAENLELVEKF